MTPLTLPGLLEVLGHNGVGRVALCEQSPGGQFVSRLLPTHEVPATLPGDRNWWFGVNPLRTDLDTGRGGTEDVTHLTSLYADLDMKAGGLGSWEAVDAVIDDLSGLLDTRPVAVTFSGHGKQPFWLIDTETAPLLTGLDAMAVLRRFGRLVSHVAAIHGGKVDSVYDLARILRAPGSHNLKSEPYLPVVTTPDTGRPLTPAEIDEQLLAYGVPEVPEDRELLTDVVCSPREWAWSETTCGYARRMVAGWTTDAPEARHPWLVGQATRLALAHRHGCLTERDHEEAVRTLTARFRALLGRGQQRQEQRGEITGALSWGAQRAATKTDAGVYRELGGHGHGDDDPLVDPLTDSATSPLVDSTPAAPTPGVEGFGDLFAARPELDLIRQWARARMAHPLAVLGYVLARVVASTPKFVVLPPVVGGEVSLNLFLALVAPSGGGKGVASKTSNAALRCIGGSDYITAQVGSGEGIAHLYMRRGTKAEGGGVIQHRDSVLFDVAEVDKLAALGARQGSTLLSELRAAWMGEQLGFGYADPTKALIIGEHRYRMCLTLGVQPGRGYALLSEDEVAGGTPQRFTWLPTTDPNMPDPGPDPAKPLEWRMPKEWPIAFGGISRIQVCNEAVQAIQDAHRRRQRGEVDTAIDGHALLAREKLAAAFGLLAGRPSIEDEDWQLAGVLAEVSAATRQSVADELTRRSAQENERRAVARGRADVITSETVDEAKEKRAGQAIMRRLERANGDGWITAGALRRALRSTVREAFESAVEHLLATGQIEAREREYQGAVTAEYRKAE